MGATTRRSSGAIRSGAEPTARYSMPSVQSGNDGPSFRDSRADGSKASVGVGGVGLLGRQRQADEGEPRIHQREW